MHASGESASTIAATLDVLYPPAATPGITDAERSTIAEMMAKGAYGTLLLATKGPVGTFERLRPTFKLAKPRSSWSRPINRKGSATPPSAILRAT